MKFESDVRYLKHCAETMKIALCKHALCKIMGYELDSYARQIFETRFGCTMKNNSRHHHQINTYGHATPADQLSSLFPYSESLLSSESSLSLDPDEYDHDEQRSI